MSCLQPAPRSSNCPAAAPRDEVPVRFSPVHPRISINQVCFAASAPLEFLAHARTLGAQRIGLSSHWLLAQGGTAQTQAMLAGSPSVETICHPFAIYPSLEGSFDRARDALLNTIEIGAQLRTRSIYLLTGGRGSLSWEHAAERFVEAVTPCRAAAKAAGLALMIENASALYADLHIAHSLADTIRLAEMAEIGVCIELFHCWAEASLKDLFGRALPRCGLVQVSDYVLGDRALPNRAVPGDGAIPLERIIGMLLKGGYGGAFDIELIGPRIDAEGHLAAANRAAEYLSEILMKLQA
jgi:sugar phosphate isomerase/epimerase